MNDNMEVHLHIFEDGLKTEWTTYILDEGLAQIFLNRIEQWA